MYALLSKTFAQISGLALAVMLAAACVAPPGDAPDEELSAREQSDQPGTDSDRTRLTKAGAPQFGAGLAQGVADSVVLGNPDNYLALLLTLKPGDTLLLAPGDYDVQGRTVNLPVVNLNGTQDRPIIITGPDHGAKPRFLGRDGQRVIQVANSSYVAIRQLEIDGRGANGIAIAATEISHHILIESVTISGMSNNQQNVGISTSGAATWNWTIRGNRILDAGTGMYFGNSDGSNPFVAGLIEENIVRNTIGYNLQIKHQKRRPPVAGMPLQPGRTVIRRNVFNKTSNSSGGGLARPNLLVGHFPLEGNGSEDLYEIYGNFFWQNPSEALFQGEGNVAFYSNLLVNHAGPAIHIQPHNDVPRSIRIFGNTVLASGAGIVVVGGDPRSVQSVIGNVVFANDPIRADYQVENAVGRPELARRFLRQPDPPLRRLDASPQPRTLTGRRIEIDGVGDLDAAMFDFNGELRDWTIRGAYTGMRQSRHWRPTLEQPPKWLHDSERFQ